MKIFISWSGNKSSAFASVFKPWLEKVLPGTEVWLSSEDIDKGTIWFSEIIDELENCHCGVLCITRENHSSPWIHFEAGGMIKGLGKSRVATILLDLDHGDLKQPLNQFNGLRVNRQGAYHLVKSFNKISEKPIKEDVIESIFDAFWPNLEKAYKKLFPDLPSLERGEWLHMVSEPVPDKNGDSPSKEVTPLKKKNGKKELKQLDLFT